MDYEYDAATAIQENTDKRTWMMLVRYCADMAQVAYPTIDEMTELYEVGLTPRAALERLLDRRRNKR